MATDWASIAQTAASALGGGAVGAWLNGVRQDRADRDRRRDQAAEILAEARALLTDGNPDRLGLNAHPAMFDHTFPELTERWQQTRVRLLTLSAGHPSKRVRVLAGQLEVAIANTLTQAQWLVGDILKNRDHTEAQRTANEANDKATRLLVQLEQAIHRTGRRALRLSRNPKPLRRIVDRQQRGDPGA
jgi:hypothetical protein